MTLSILSAMNWDYNSEWDPIYISIVSYAGKVYKASVSTCLKAQSNLDSEMT